MQDISFSNKNRTRKVTINVTDEEKGLYDLLSTEYGVKMNEEMWKVMSERIKQIRDTVIPKAG